MNFFTIILLSTLTLADDPKPVLAAKPVPQVEEVPKPAAGPDEIPDTKVSKGVKEAVEETKIGLIKTEKVYVDKSCHMVKGKLKCKKKKVKPKTIDSDKDLLDIY